MRIHIVQKGDTLWKLAQKYGVSLDELKAANSNLSNPDLIMPGMKIKIPTGKVQATKESVKKEMPLDNVKKEQPKKEQPIAKEAPKKEKTPPPSIKEEKETPIPMPTPPQVPMTQQPSSFHLQKTNMNFNIYKQNQEVEIPAPPKMPEQKEMPKVEEKPKQEPIKSVDVKEQPKVKPVPMAMDKAMQAHCYPVTPVYQYGCAPCPPGYPQPYYPLHQHQHVVPGYPVQPMPSPAMPPQPQHYGFPQQEMPSSEVEVNEMMDMNDSSYQNDIAGYGDVTSQQLPNQANVHVPTPTQSNQANIHAPMPSHQGQTNFHTPMMPPQSQHHGPGMPVYPQQGFAPYSSHQYMQHPQQQHNQTMGWRDTNTNDEDNDN